MFTTVGYFGIFGAGAFFDIVAVLYVAFILKGVCKIPWHGARALAF